MSCVLCGEDLRKRTRRRRSRAISFLELFSHATVVLTLTSVTCNCYVLSYTPRCKRRTRNATHYSRATHVSDVSSDLFFSSSSRGEQCASAKTRVSGYVISTRTTRRVLFFVRSSIYFYRRRFIVQYTCVISR